MAGVEGFEPSNAGVKVLCLTAWLHPSIGDKDYSLSLFIALIANTIAVINATFINTMNPTSIIVAIICITIADMLITS